MSNFLDKWRPRAAPQEQETNRRETTRALVLQSVRESADFKPSQAEPPARPVDTRKYFNQLCFCALRDLPFVVRYERQPNGRYRALESVQLQQGGASGREGQSETFILPTDQIDGGHTPCAWCGTTGHYHCHCGGVICGGKVKGNLFTCRVSCGAQWIMGPPVTEINLAKPEPPERQEWKAPPRKPAASYTPAKPEPEIRLQLGPASQIGVRRTK